MSPATMREQTPSGAVHSIPLSALKQTSMTPSTKDLRTEDLELGSIEAKDIPTIRENVIRPELEENSF